MGRGEVNGVGGWPWKVVVLEEGVGRGWRGRRWPTLCKYLCSNIFHET